MVEIIEAGVADVHTGRGFAAIRAEVHVHGTDSHHDESYAEKPDEQLGARLGHPLILGGSPLGFNRQLLSSTVGPGTPIIRQLYNTK